MIDMGTSEGRIISAAMRLAAERPWQEVSLREIAEAAGMNLAGLSDYFSSKTDILRAFVKRVDHEVLAQAPVPQPGESKRDALFEVVMARFDVLAPYKSALRSIARSGETEVAMVGAIFASQGWMLQAAGIDSEGPAGVLRTVGLASVYQSAFRTWLDDDDPGQARTMAVLDRMLHRGESFMGVLDGALDAARRVKDALRSGAGAGERSRPSRGEEPGSNTDASGPATGDGGPAAAT
jgi:ubiquinone biosynthesis protein COQ9